MYIDNSKYKYNDEREVLIEKFGCFHELEKYNVKSYDTVELVLTTGEKLAEGVFFGSGGYRGVGKNKVMGYFTVSLFLGNNHKEFSDFEYIRKINFDDGEKQTKFLRLYPGKCVLIEKNIIKRYEDMLEEMRKEWRRNPIYGG